MDLVVGATGLLGGQIARGLLAQGRDVRILVRTGSDHTALVQSGAQPVPGDLKDAASLDVACAGVDTVVATAISLGRRPDDTIQRVELDGYRDLLRAATRAGARRIVFVSMLGADEASPAPFIAAKGITERRVRESGMTWTILAPNAFMDVWLYDVVARPVLAGDDVVYVGSGGRRHAWVHSRDVAALAISSVDHPAAANRSIVLAGPEAISFQGVTAIFEKLLGRPIGQRGVAPGQPVPGLPSYEVELMAGFEGFESVLDTSAVAQEFGLRLTSVEEWAAGLTGVLSGVH